MFEQREKAGQRERRRTRGAWRACELSSIRRASLILAICFTITVFAQPAPEAQPSTTELSTVPESPQESPTTLAQNQAQEDIAAAIYMRKCRGCHTIGGGALSGPDLKPIANWPRNDAQAAIVRMEKNVGPLTEDELQALTELLLSAEAAQRLEQQQQRVALQEAAQLEPASPETGRALFHGSRSLQHRGISCSACHQAGGRGGSVATSLEDAFSRLGETALKSTMENPGFPVMRAIYSDEPVSKQEAIHIAAYLEQIERQPKQAAHYPMEAVGLAGAIVLMGLLHPIFKSRARGTRARLVAGARQQQ